MSRHLITVVLAIACIGITYLALFRGDGRSRP